MRLAGLALAAALFGLAACAAPAAPAAPVAAPSARELEGEAVCKAHNGVIRQVGVGGQVRRCVIRYRDAGRVCANDADCEGECWISGAPVGRNKTARGQCQPTNMPFGCHATLDKGIVSPEICVD